jgi:hypothetical protein
MICSFHFILLFMVATPYQRGQNVRDGRFKVVYLLVVRATSIVTHLAARLKSMIKVLATKL